MTSDANFTDRRVISESLQSSLTLFDSKGFYQLMLFLDKKKHSTTESQFHRDISTKFSHNPLSGLWVMTPLGQSTQD